MRKYELFIENVTIKSTCECEVIENFSRNHYEWSRVEYLQTVLLYLSRAFKYHRYIFTNNRSKRACARVWLTLLVFMTDWRFIYHNCICRLDSRMTFYMRKFSSRVYYCVFHREIYSIFYPPCLNYVCAFVNYSWYW